MEKKDNPELETFTILNPDFYVEQDNKKESTETSIEKEEKVE